ncbi:hypothetical protein [Demequina globuliformis]|uniref:hypothetical protein n=1 Tax=Demequina globuliformis TaxID=676202 RepID=UPI0007817B79|nr:hypothetical protein [Demequina globuliformis]
MKRHAGGFVVATAAVAAVTGCASAATAPAGASGSLIPADALVGIRVEGSVTLDAVDGARCWQATYDGGAGFVESPFLVPEGYTKQDIVMADPMNPGSDLPNPALMNADGDPVGFSSTRSIVSAQYWASDDPAIADAATECGFTGTVLVADAPHGVTMDPDGIESAVRICDGTDGTVGMETDPVPLPDLSSCTTSPLPHPVASVG